MKRLFILVMLALILTLAFPLTAQETTLEPDATPTAETTPEPLPTPPPLPDPTPLPDEPPIATPGDILERLFAVLQGTYIGWAAAGTLVIVGLIKALLARFGIVAEGQGAAILAVTVQVLIWLLYNIAVFFGAAEQFRTGYLAVIEVLKSLLPFVLGLFVTNGAYQLARKQAVPLVGYRPARKPKLVG